MDEFTHNLNNSKMLTDMHKHLMACVSWMDEKKNLIWLKICLFFNKKVNIQLFIYSFIIMVIQRGLAYTRAKITILCKLIQLITRYSHKIL